jgi:hypothetical protein
MPSVCSQHPKKEGLAIGPLAWGGGGAGRIPASASARPGQQAARIGSTMSREGSRMVGRTGEGRGR